ncbi:MAG: hypothetical protein AB7U62_01600 [Pseudolabrys sp.]
MSCQAETSFVETSFAPRVRDRGERLPDCPHCGDMLVAPDISMFDGQNADGRGLVRHVWSCESCGERSETAVLVVH